MVNTNTNRGSGNRPQAWSLWRCVSRAAWPGPQAPQGYTAMTKNVNATPVNFTRKEQRDRMCRNKESRRKAAISIFLNRVSKMKEPKGTQTQNPTHRPDRNTGLNLYNPKLNKNQNILGKQSIANYHLHYHFHLALKSQIMFLNV